MYSESSKTSKLELFEKIIKSFQLLTIFAKNSSLDVRPGSEYLSDSGINFKIIRGITNYQKQTWK